MILEDFVISPDTLVDVGSIPSMRGIKVTPPGISIGAVTRVADIASHRGLPACLTQGAGSIGSPQIRNLATIGGNICNASPCGDTLPSLIALDAVFVLASATGTREVKAEDFFLGPKKTVIKEGELLVEIRIDALHRTGSSAFRMIGKRNGQVISQVNAALWLLAEKGTISDARAAIGSVTGPSEAAKDRGAPQGEENERTRRGGDPRRGGRGDRADQRRACERRTAGS